LENRKRWKEGKRRCKGKGRGVGKGKREGRVRGNFSTPPLIIL